MAESTYSQRYAADDSSTAGAFAFDTIAAKDYAVSKLAFGAVGSVTYVSAADPLPVTISGVATAAAQATGNTSLASIDGKITAVNTGAVVLAAGAAAFGKLAANDGVDIGDVTINNASLAVTGTFWQATQPVSMAAMPGTFAEDTAHASGDVGCFMLGVRNSSAVPLTSDDGDYSPFATDSVGRIGICDLGGAITVDFGGSAGPVTIAAGSTTIAKAEDTASANTDVGVPAMAVRKAAPANTSNLDGDYEFLQMSAGRLWVDASGVSLTVASHEVTNAGTFAVQESGAALTALQLIDNAVVDHGAAVVAGVRPIGLDGRSADGTAVTSGQATRALGTLLGKQVQVPYALPGSSWSYAAASGGIVNTTGVTAKAAAGVGIRNYVTRVQAINGHATVDTDVQIRDGASGTVLWRGFAKAAGGGCAAEFDPPLRGTANTLVEVAAGTTGSAVYVNCQGFSAGE